MKAYSELSNIELQQELAEQRERFAAYKQRGLKLNMARGKPSPEQLDLSLPMLDLLSSQDSSDALLCGTADDLRNYGNLTGLAEARELMGALMGVPAANVLIGGNSSLELMYNMVSRAMTHGVLGSTPWAQLDEQPVFLCPVPGYDRHFSVTEHFGIKMVPVPLFETGPDMDVVEELVSGDPLVKGIWCVPRFSNPSGCVYSDETVLRFAALKPAAQDFRIYWDNAYVVHEFMTHGDGPRGSFANHGDGSRESFVGTTASANHGDGSRESFVGTTASVVRPQPQRLQADERGRSSLLNIKEACEAADNGNIWYQFSSTSKITFAGSGMAAMACSEENLASIVKALGYQTIGPDKINQRRHTLFLPNLEAVHQHMAKHAALLAPKFEMVGRVLAEGLTKAGISSWTNPQGGYFISFDGPPHTAKRTVELAAEAGVVLTPAGATYPYGKDPLDANIRIAPSYPCLEELELAAEVLVTCVLIAALEQLLG